MSGTESEALMRTEYQTLCTDFQSFAESHPEIQNTQKLIRSKLASEKLLRLPQESYTRFGCVGTTYGNENRRKRSFRSRTTSTASERTIFVHQKSGVSYKDFEITSQTIV